MSKPRPNENVPTPPQRDLAREARRLARVQRLRLVSNESPLDHLRPPDPKRAA
jgi:hypothetical protein